jgi:hypothetical protein
MSDEPTIVPAPENFSNAPTSIAELRAHKAEDARKWTPRDVLVSLLRDIDKGEIAPDQLVVCMSRDNEDGSAISWYRQAVRRPYVSVGLLARIQFMILRESIPSA